MIGKNSWKKYSIYIPIIIFIFAFIMNIVLTIPIYNVQDEGGLYFYIKHFYETNINYMNPALNNHFNTTIFHPSYAVYTLNGDIITKSPKSLMFIMLMPYEVFGKYIIYFNSILSAFIVLLVYCMTYKISKKVSFSIFSCLIVMFMPVFLRYSTSFFNIIFAIFINLLIFYILIFKEDFNEKIKYIIVSILINLLLYIRLADGLLFLPIYLFLIFIIPKKNSPKLNFKKVLIFLIIFSISFLIFQLPFLIDYNHKTISSPFIGSYPYISKNLTLNHDSYIESYNSSLFDKIIAFPLGTKNGFQNFSLSNYSHNIYSNASSLIFIGPSPLFIINLLVLFLLLYTKINKTQKIYILISFLILILILLFYGPRVEYYGIGSENISSSMYRYFLIEFIFISCSFPIILDIIKSSFGKKFFIIFGIILLISLEISIYYSIETNYKGVKLINQYKINQMYYLNEFSALNNQSSVFITGYSTDRYTYITDSDLSYNRNINYFLGSDLINTKIEEDFFNESIRVINELINENYSVYFIYSPYDSISPENFYKLINNNFEVTEITINPNPDNIKLFKLNKKVS